MTYGRFHEATILEVISPPYLFCFSYAPTKGGKAKVVSLPDFPLYKREPRNDREVVKALYRVISASDVIVAHNIAFDLRTAYARFIYHRLPPIKPVRTHCTLRMARRIGNFPANTLKQVALYLGVTHKMETSKNLWQDIHFRQDPKAWKEMVQYNKVDTIAGVEIYKILQGWTGRPDTERLRSFCDCGSSDVQFRGLNHNGTKRQFVCKKCKKWSSMKI